MAVLCTRRGSCPALFLCLCLCLALPAGCVDPVAYGRQLGTRAPVMSLVPPSATPRVMPTCTPTHPPNWLHVDGRIVSVAPDPYLLVIQPYGGGGNRVVFVSTAPVHDLHGIGLPMSYVKQGLDVAVEGTVDSNGHVLASDVQVLLQLPAASATPTRTPTPVPTEVPGNVFVAQFYSNPSLAGNPVRTEKVVAINYNWHGAAPGPGLPNRGYSGHWEGQFGFPRGGRYRFVATLDGGMRLAVDGRTLIDRWDGPVGGECAGELDLPAGWHAITVEYHNLGGQGLLQVRWEIVNPGT